MSDKTFAIELLHDPELILRVKRRVGPALWSTVPWVLEALEEALPTMGKPDPRAPKPEPERPRKKAAKKRKKRA